MKKLKRCPFCGGKAVIVHDDKANGYYITCSNGTECWIVPRTSLYTGLETAIEAWNRRVTDDN